MSDVIRVFVEKKPGFDVEARQLLADLQEHLGISSLRSLRLLHRYDVSGLSREEFAPACRTIFSEPNVDEVYEEEVSFPSGWTAFALSLIHI